MIDSSIDFRVKETTYAKQALCSLSFVSFLSSTVVYLYLWVLFVLNCYATMLWWWNKVVCITRGRFGCFSSHMGNLVHRLGKILPKLVRFPCTTNRVVTGRRRAHCKSTFTCHIWPWLVKRCIQDPTELNIWRNAAVLWRFLPRTCENNDHGELCCVHTTSPLSNDQFGSHRRRRSGWKSPQVLRCV